MNKTKGKIAVLVGIIGVIIAVVMLFNTDLEHIEDTNGVENFELQTITDKKTYREYFREEYKYENNKV